MYILLLCVRVRVSVHTWYYVTCMPCSDSDFAAKPKKKVCVSVYCITILHDSVLFTSQPKLVKISSHSTPQAILARSVVSFT